MSILTITNGASNELAVVKLSPVEEECFTLYEYNVDTNNGDEIDIEITGNHFDAKYFDKNGNSTSFSDTTTLNFNEFLKVRFLLLNSGTNGVFSNATIRITNTSNMKYYENLVIRENDTENCYKSTNVPTKTSDLLNDGENGTSTYIETIDLDLNDYVPYSGANRDINIGNNFITDGQGAGGFNLFYGTITDQFTVGLIQIGDGSNTGNKSIFFDDGNGNNSELFVDVNDSNKLKYFNDELNTTIEIGSGGGSITIDSSITDGSTNPVQNNAIHDALVLKANDNEVVKLTGTQTISGTKSFESLWADSIRLYDNSSAPPLLTWELKLNPAWGPSADFNRLWFNERNLAWSKEGDIATAERTEFFTNPTSINVVTWPDKSGTVTFLDDLDKFSTYFSNTYTTTTSGSETVYSTVIPLNTLANTGDILEFEFYMRSSGGINGNNVFGQISFADDGYTLGFLSSTTGNVQYIIKGKIQRISNTEYLFNSFYGHSQDSHDLVVSKETLASSLFDSDDINFILSIQNGSGSGTLEVLGGYIKLI